MDMYSASTQIGSDVFKKVFDYMFTQSIELAMHSTNNKDNEKDDDGSLIERLCELQPLTAVCKSWRRATLPLFYQSAVCSIKENSRNGKITLRKHSGIKEKKLSQRSNVNLIISAGYTRSVRRLIIDLSGDVKPDLPVALLSEHRFHKHSWRSIEYLKFTHYTSQSQATSVYTSESIAKLNAYLLHAAPNLNTVRYNSSEDSKCYEGFPLEGLIGSTLGQLKDISVTSGMIPSLGSSSFLPRLTSLTLKCPMHGTAADRLPRIYAESLVLLKIGFTSAEHIWDRFYITGSALKTEFKRLESLTLYYHKSDNALDESEPAVIPRSESPTLVEAHEDNDDGDANVTNALMEPLFPKLQHLSVVKYPHDIMRVLKYFPLDQVPYVTLRGVGHGVSKICPMDMAEFVSCYIDSPRLMDSKEEDAFQGWVNQVFSVTSRFQRLQLQARTTRPISLPDIIGCTRITSLSFSMGMDLGTIPNLLSRLPCLLKLALHVHPNSTWSVRNSTINDDYQMLAYLPSLSTSLESLVAYVVDVPGGSNGTVERELAWIIARVPSLMLFMTEEWTKAQVNSILKEMLACSEATYSLEHIPDIEMASWKY